MRNRGRAGETGDRHGEGIALGDLGVALVAVRRFDEAITAHQDAIAIYRETGDRHREGRALNDLGLALEQVGEAGRGDLCPPGRRLDLPADQG